MKPTVCAENRTMERCPSQIWYLMLDSDVRPTRGKIDDPLVTGKKRNAQHIFPIYPSLNEILLSLVCHLQREGMSFSYSFDFGNALLLRTTILLLWAPSYSF